MKSLKGIQVFAKIGEVLSKILFILAIIGCAGCIIGLLSIITVGTNKDMIIEGMTLDEYFQINANMNLNTAYVMMIVAIVVCGVEIFLAKISNNYFKHELEVGHPFTKDLVKELRKLGIIVLAVTFGASLVCSIGVSIARKLVTDIANIDSYNFTQLGVGLGMILISFICEYVVEKDDKATSAIEAEVVNEFETK